MLKYIFGAFLLFSSSAMAVTVGTPETTTWDGVSPTFAAECTFTNNNPGTMVLTGTVWTVTTPAVVTLKTREVNEVTVTSDNVLRLESSSDGVDTATVNYSGSTVVGGPVGMATSVTPSLIEVTNVKVPGASVFTINIDGTATLVNTDALASSENYYINHVVTCVQ